MYKITHKDANPMPSVEIRSRSAKSACKLYSLILKHGGRLNKMTSAPNSIIVVEHSSSHIFYFNVWYADAYEKIYAECILSQMPGLTLEPCADVSINDPIFLESKSFNSPHDVLKEVFGFTEFKTGQQKAVSSALDNINSIIVIPTGGGKTIIFTIPTLMNGGMSVVISPLLMLMHEQVNLLRKYGINSCYYNNLISEERKQNILHAICQKDCPYQFLFVSPEAALSSLFTKTMENYINKGRKITYLIIDEAHCIHQWGHDFRPAYMELHKLKEIIKCPTLALTATASLPCIESICKSLDLTDKIVLKLPSRRSNLSLNIMIKSENYIKTIADLINSEFSDQCGIIYCLTRSETSSVALELAKEGISAIFFHGDLDSSEKIQNADAWLKNKVCVICATSAFGMGIDKPDVRYVFQLSIPGSMEQYAQEVGRAGRDGEPARCILLAKFSDRNFHFNNISKIQDKSNQLSKIKDLMDVSKYCFTNNLCRQLALSEFFNDPASDPCIACDYCCQESCDIKKDFTAQAISVVNCLNELKRFHYNVTRKILTMTYIGSKSKDARTKGLDKSSFFGEGKNIFKSSKNLDCFIDQLIVMEILKENIVQSTVDNYIVSLENYRDISFENLIVLF